MLQLVARNTAVALGALLLVASISAQEIEAKERKALLLAGNAQYYNLRAAGLKSFGCDVKVDWQGLFKSAAGKTVGEDDTILKYLRGGHLSFTDDVAAGPQVTWATPAPPAESDKASADQMVDGLKTMVTGFLTAWNPSLNGSTITQSPLKLEHSGTGYLLTESSETDKAVSTLDHALVVSHVSYKSPAMESDMIPSYTTAPVGLLMTKLEATYLQPPTAPPVHLVMETTFAPVGGFQVPASLAATIVNTLTVQMQFTGCTVIKQ